MPVVKCSTGVLEERCNVLTRTVMVMVHVRLGRHRVLMAAPVDAL